MLTVKQNFQQGETTAAGATGTCAGLALDANVCEDDHFKSAKRSPKKTTACER